MIRAIDTMIKTEIKMNPYEIADAILTWHGGCYFIGDACGKCNCTVNTFGNAPGWFCPNCDHFNNQCSHGGMMQWDKPDYGPTRRIIYKGGKLSQRDTLRRRKFADGQRVFINLRGYSFRSYEADWRAARIVSIRDECYCGMRWYNVVLPDGTEKMIYEENIDTTVVLSIKQVASRN